MLSERQYFPLFSIEETRLSIEEIGSTNIVKRFHLILSTIGKPGLFRIIRHSNKILFESVKWPTLGTNSELFQNVFFD
jgi:hypothetical protein